MKDTKTIEVMVRMYCAGLHKTKRGFCRDCAGLLDYARMRLDKCPFGAKKPACAKCTVHCYSPSMRSKVTAVMKYAGPRMILKHPILSVLHSMRGRQ